MVLGRLSLEVNSANYVTFSFMIKEEGLVSLRTRAPASSKSSLCVLIKVCEQGLRLRPSRRFVS
jgi:hypothetical protein